MSGLKSSLVLLALAGVMLAVGFAPAAAQDTQRAKRELAAQHRPQIVIHPRHRLGPNATRHCVAWLAQETWPNGEVVITPQKRCWWED